MEITWISLVTLRFRPTLGPPPSHAEAARVETMHEVKQKCLKEPFTAKFIGLLFCPHD